LAQFEVSALSQRGHVSILYGFESSGKIHATRSASSGSTLGNDVLSRELGEATMDGVINPQIDLGSKFFQILRRQFLLVSNQGKQAVYDILRRPISTGRDLLLHKLTLELHQRLPIPLRRHPRFRPAGTKWTSAWSSLPSSFPPSNRPSQPQINPSADFTETFPAIATAPDTDFTSQNMHIFFGAGAWKQIRFTASPEK
jgi:hypothetical protein